MRSPVQFRVLTLLALLLATRPEKPVRAQEPAAAEAVSIGSSIIVTSAILDEDRRVLVFVPAVYDTGGMDRYPVLYLLDGETHFHHVTGIADFLSAAFHIPPMIVVGIVNTDRTRDLTPVAQSATVTLSGLTPDEPVSIRFPSSGGADAFLRFITEELAPRIERDYRTAPFRILAGHSLSGLFTLHAATTQPASFRAYIAASPSLYWDDRAVVRHASAGNLAGLDGRMLYLTVGDLEMSDMLSNARRFALALEQRAPAGLRWWYRVMPHESHPSVMHLSVYESLETIFADYRIAETELGFWDAAAVEAHFARLSQIYGWTMQVPEHVLSVMSYIKLAILQRPDDAIAILCRAVELYPESTSIRGALADARKATVRTQDATRVCPKRQP